MWLAVFVDDQPRPAGARVFLAPGEVEIPRTENVRTNADMAEVGVITFEWTLARNVDPTANFDAAVAFARQAITQLKFKVSKMLILPNEIGQSVGAPVPDNRSIANGPVGRTLPRNGSPARKGFAIEDGGKTVCVCGPLRESGGNDAAQNLGHQVPALPRFGGRVLCRERGADARQEQGNRPECERCGSYDCFSEDRLVHGSCGSFL